MTGTEVLTRILHAAGITDNPNPTIHGGLAQWVARAIDKGWTVEALTECAAYVARQANGDSTKLINRLTGMMAKKAGEAPPVDIDTNQPRRPALGMSPPVGPTLGLHEGFGDPKFGEHMGDVRAALARGAAVAEREREERLARAVEQKRSGRKHYR